MVGYIKDTDLKKLIDKLNHQELKTKLKNLDKVYNEFSWMKEKKKIKNIYKDYLNVNFNRCLMDSTVPEIKFDDDGFCNFCTHVMKDSFMSLKIDIKILIRLLNI